MTAAVPHAGSPAPIHPWNVSESPTAAHLASPNDMAVVWAADDAGLSQSEHRLFSRIYRRFNPRRGCDESLPKMAVGCKMHEDTARSALKVLEARRMVRVTERTGQSKRIDVLSPEEWQAETVATPPRNEGGTSNTPPRNEGTGTPPKPGGTKYSLEADPLSSPPKRAKTPPVSEPLPDWIDPALWADWEAHRREKRQTLTPTQTRYQIQKLTALRNNGQDPNAVIRRSLSAGWIGFFSDESTVADAPADAGGGGGAVGKARGAGRQDSPDGRRGAGRAEPVRATAAQRASTVTIAGLQRLYPSGNGPGPAEGGPPGDFDGAGERGAPPRLT